MDNEQWAGCSIEICQITGSAVHSFLPCSCMSTTTYHGCPEVGLPGWQTHPSAWWAGSTILPQMSIKAQRQCYQQPWHRNVPQSCPGTQCIVSNAGRLQRLRWHADGQLQQCSSNNRLITDQLTELSTDNCCWCC